MDPEVQNQQSNKVLDTKPGSSFSSIRVFSFVVIAVLVLSGSAALIWFLILSPQETSTIDSTPAPTTKTDTVPDIKSDKDLENLEKEVNDTDVDGLSKDLDANDKDSEDF